MRVLIIGAGLGGLCLAQALRRAGIGAAVYERDGSLPGRAQGYRLHLDPDGLRALDAALPPRLADLVRATAGTPAQRSVFLDHRLATLADVAVATDDGPHLAVNRLTLREILASGTTVTFDRRLVSYRADADGVTATFADGTSDRGDLLVGADGIGSAVRRQLLPTARTVDTGLRQIYGRVPLTAATRAPLTPEMRTIFTGIMGPDRTFVGLGAMEYPEPVAAAFARLAPGIRPQPTADYLTCSFGGRRETLPANLETLDAGALHGLVRRAVADWHPTVRALVAACDPVTLFPATLRTSVPVDNWPAGRVTLLGDAIHAMSPAGGVGANTALRDAVTLAAALSGGMGLLDAVDAYQAGMLDYGFAAVRASAANGARFLGQDPLPVA